MRLVLLAAIIGILDALHCDKDFNFYDNYGNGFDISCQDLTQEYFYLLQNITISNEISLKIINSSLTEVSSKIFQNVQHIRKLYIENSTFTFPHDESVFGLLSYLEHLFITNTTLHLNKYTLTGLKNLKELVLSNNRLQKIEEGSLKDLVGLEILQITENNLRDIANLPLCELKNLKHLNLSNNLIGNLENIFALCKSPSKSIDFSVNSQYEALSVPHDDYMAVYDFKSDLTELDLSHNKIKELGDSFHNFRYIKVLKLQGNLLSELTNSVFQFHDDLEEVYLFNNYITQIENKVFNGKDNLEHLDLSRNALTFISIDRLPMLRILNLGSNKLKVDSLDVINSTEALQKLYLGDNDISEIKPNILRKFSSLELLDLKNNHINLNNFSFAGLVELKFLYLAGNKIETLPELIFEDLKNLQTLDLSNNQLKVITYKYTFKELGNLNILNISHNNLESLDYALLQPLKNLHSLDVANNNLHYIQYESIISNLPALSFLNIKANQLSCEFLVKMVGYLKHNGISYTLQETIDIDKENVAGIYCRNEGDRENKTNPSESNTVATGHGVGNSESNSLKPESGPSSLFVASITIFLVIVSGVVIYRLYFYLKRIRYKVDEFELITED